MNILYAIKYEGIHILRSPYKIIAILLFLVVSVYGMHNGYTLYKERSNEIQNIKEKSQSLQNKAFDWYKNGEKGPSERPWVDISSPLWSVLYVSPNVFDEPSPLMTYSIGQAEQFAYYKSVDIRSTAYDKDLTAEISNPERVSIGSLDFSFVWLFLMPLVLIVLTYSIHGLERDLGFMKLLSVQEPGRRSWITKRFIAIALFSSFFLMLLIWIPSLMGGYLKSHSGDLGLLFLYKFLYLLFWIFLLGLLSFYGKGQTDTALKMVGLWLCLTIVLPGLLHQYIFLKHPPGLMMEIVNAQREDQEKIYDTGLDTIKNKIFEAYPVFSGTILGKEDSLANNQAIRGLYQFAFNQHMNGVVKGVVDDHIKRNDLIKSTYFFNPVTAFQNLINAVAETDFETNQRFRMKIQETASQMNKQLLKDELNEVKVDEEQFKYYINLFSEKPI